MKVAVIANCQAPGVARSVRFFLPGASVSHFRYNDIKSVDRLSAVADELTGFDLILSQHTENPFFESLDSSRLLERGLNAKSFPPVVFQGFHPDMTYLRYSGKELTGPLDTYHSRLVAACFLKGIEALKCWITSMPSILRDLVTSTPMSSRLGYSLTDVRHLVLNLADIWTAGLGRGPLCTPSITLESA